MEDLPEPNSVYDDAGEAQEVETMSRKRGRENSPASIDGIGQVSFRINCS